MGLSFFDSQIRCSYGRYCQSGYYCDYYRCCRPNNQRRCSHHAHCPQGWYCDYNTRYCKVGERRCSHPYHCSRDQVCVNGKCRKRECYYHNQCKQGYYCAAGICKALPGACSSHGSCKDTQCCSKYHPGQTTGICRELKKPNEFCPMKVRTTLKIYVSLIDRILPTYLISVRKHHAFYTTILVLTVKF